MCLFQKKFLKIRNNFWNEPSKRCIHADLKTHIRKLETVDWEIRNEEYAGQLVSFFPGKLWKSCSTTTNTNTAKLDIDCITSPLPPLSFIIWWERINWTQRTEKNKFEKIKFSKQAGGWNPLPRIRHSVRPSSSVTEMTDPSFSNALLYWMFRDQ